MRRIFNTGGMAAAIGAMAVALAPTVAFGQSGSAARSSGVPNYHLLQLSVAASAIPLEEFRDRTRTIRSCQGAMTLAEDLDADVKRDRFVPSWSLPNGLRETLGELPTGHATRVFSDNPAVMRVLVICYRV